MIKSHTHTTRLLGEGAVSLGRSFIDDTTITMDGEALPAWIDLNAARGTVSRTDGAANDYTQYEFSFDYFAPARVDCSISPASIPADGITEATLTVECEDATLEAVIIAVFDGLDSGPIGIVEIALSNGIGTKQFTSEVADTYRYFADLSVLNEAWSRSEYERGNTAVLEVVNA